jgi:hypothetical protein
MIRNSASVKVPDCLGGTGFSFNYSYFSWGDIKMALRFAVGSLGVSKLLWANPDLLPVLIN